MLVNNNMSISTKPDMKPVLDNSNNTGNNSTLWIIIALIIIFALAYAGYTRYYNQTANIEVPANNFTVRGNTIR